MPLLKILSPAYYRGLGKQTNGTEKSFLANFCPMVWCRLLTTRIYNDHYQTLELKSNASPAEIKEAYYRLSKIFHPDVYRDDANSEKFKSISAAYEVLSDPTKKAQYDVERQFPSRSTSHGAGQYGTSRYPGNAEYRGGPRRNPTAHSGSTQEEYDEWVHQTFGYRAQNAQSSSASTSSKRSPRKREAGYTYFWHFFWGTLVTWVSLTGFVFFSDQNQFGSVQGDLRDELRVKARLKELKYSDIREGMDERRNER